MAIAGFSFVWFIATDNGDNKKELFQGSFEVLNDLGKGFIFFPFCDRNNARYHSWALSLISIFQPSLEFSGVLWLNSSQCNVGRSDEYNARSPLILHLFPLTGIELQNVCEVSCCRRQKYIVEGA